MSNKPKTKKAKQTEPELPKREILKLENEFLKPQKKSIEYAKRLMENKDFKKDIKRFRELIGFPIKEGLEDEKTRIEWEKDYEDPGKLKELIKRLEKECPQMVRLNKKDKEWVAKGFDELDIKRDRFIARYRDFLVKKYGLIRSYCSIVEDILFFNKCLDSSYPDFGCEFYRHEVDSLEKLKNKIVILIEPEAKITDIRKFINKWRNEIRERQIDISSKKAKFGLRARSREKDYEKILKMHRKGTSCREISKKLKTGDYNYVSKMIERAKKTDKTIDI